MSSPTDQFKKLDAAMQKAAQRPMPKYYENDEGRVFEANEAMHMVAHKHNLRPYRGPLPEDPPFTSRPTIDSSNDGQETADDPETEKLRARILELEGQLATKGDTPAGAATAPVDAGQTGGEGGQGGPETTEREQLVAAYLARFGRKPHHNSSDGRIREELEKDSE